MRIFAAGISTETNTFAPIPTSVEDFFIQRGRDALAGRIDYPNLDLSSTWGAQARERGDELIFSFNAWAQPSGTTLKRSYESLRDEMLNDLRAALPVDIVLLSLHGAMVAQGYDDCEEDLIRGARSIVGTQAVIAVELDLHCHLAPSTIECADIVVTFKEYPHTDMNDRAREVFDLAVRAKLGRIRPTMALFDCQMIGLYPTSREPLRSFVDEMMYAEQRPGVLSISFAHGFQFADVPHVGAKVLVVTNNDRAMAERVAREFGLKAYAMRREIGFDAFSLPMETALSKALVSRRVPVVVADQSDNAGGGAPSDATFALRWLLEHRVEDAALAILHDPEVVKIARKAGIGARVAVRLGGKMGPASGEPLDVEVTVRSLSDNYMLPYPQQSGPSMLSPVGDIAALDCGGIDVVVGSKRSQCFAPTIFSELGIVPSRKRLLVVKSAQHFYSTFSALGGEVIYMAAPGAVPPDPRLIRYRRLDTARLYPWTENPITTWSPKVEA